MSLIVVYCDILEDCFGGWVGGWVSGCMWMVSLGGWLVGGC